MTNSKVIISEIFGPVIQGEGSVRGEKTVFVRVGGCDGADGSGPKSWCQWCDSVYAIDGKNFKEEWRWLTQEEILRRIEEQSNGCRSVTLTGGNPLLYDLTVLVTCLKDRGYRTLVETQGTLYKSWLALTDVVTVSPKPPSSGSPLPKDQLNEFVSQHLAFGNYIEGAVASSLTLKPVVNPDLEGDYQYAVDLALEYARFLPVYFSCYTSPSDSRDEIIARYIQAPREGLRRQCLGASVRGLPRARCAVWG